jgi:hypothetical protein
MKNKDAVVKRAVAENHAENAFKISVVVLEWLAMIFIFCWPCICCGKKPTLGVK